MAADMPVKAPPIVAPATYNWTGFYTATGLGGSWWDVDGRLFAPGFNFAHNSQASRFDYASMVGAQYQWKNIVFGVEGGYNFMGKNFASTNAPTPDCLNNPAFVGLRCSSRVDDLWTIGGRLGLAWDRFMLFGTGGYASGRIVSQTTIIAPPVTIDQTSDRHGGWYAGAGVEYFVTKLWMSDLIVGAEYQHIELDRKLDISTDGNPNDSRYYRASVDLVRARIVFKFMPAAAAGAVVAKY